MSTTTTSNDAKKMGGYFKEKFTIGISRLSGDEVSRAIAKVTSHKLKSPNEKHTLRLIAATFGHFNAGKSEYEDINLYIVKELEKHLHQRNWVPVLKTLLVFHRLMHDGSEYIGKQIGANRNLFCLSNMKAIADSPEGAMQSVFIQQYTRYLEERAICLTTIPIVHRLESDEFVEALCIESPETSVATTNAIMLMFEAACKIEFRAESINNFATQEGMKNMLKDSKRLYVVLSKRILGILDIFGALDQDTMNQWLALYKRYQEGTKHLAALFDAVNAQTTVIIGEEVPSLRLLPADIQARLEADLRGEDSSKLARAQTGGDEGHHRTAADLQRALNDAAMRTAEPTQEQQSYVQGLDLFAQAQAQDAAMAAFDQLAESSGDDLDDFFATQQKTKTTKRKETPPPVSAANVVSAVQGKRGQMSDLFGPETDQPAKREEPKPSQEQQQQQPKSLSSLFDDGAPQQHQAQTAKRTDAKKEFDPFADEPAPPANPPPRQHDTMTDFFAEKPAQRPTQSQQSQQQPNPAMDSNGRQRAW